MGVVVEVFDVEVDGRHFFFSVFFLILDGLLQHREHVVHEGFRVHLAVFPELENLAESRLLCGFL